MIDPLFLVTIIMMACVTYMTRIGGYLFLRGRTIGVRTKHILDSAPGCVLITIIAPKFFTGSWTDLLTLAVTMVVATRLPVFPTVIAAVGTAGLLRFSVGV